MKHWELQFCSSSVKAEINIKKQKKGCISTLDEIQRENTLEIATKKMFGWWNAAIKRSSWILASTNRGKMYKLLKVIVAYIPAMKICLLMLGAVM